MSDKACVKCESWCEPGRYAWTNDGVICERCRQAILLKVGELLGGDGYSPDVFGVEISWDILIDLLARAKHDPLTQTTTITVTDKERWANARE